MWKIDRDYISEPGDTSRVGYSEEHTRVPTMLAVAAGIQSEPLPHRQMYPNPNGPDDVGSELPKVRFRLRDEDNTLHYAGMLHDDDDCLNQEAALSFGMQDTGACIIEVLRDGKWVQEIG